MRKHIPTIIVAAAVLLVTAGGAFAAGHYLITSTKQIKPSVLKQLHGKAGARGMNGATGQAGIASLSSVTSPSAPLCPFGDGSCDVAIATATCPNGSYATGGSAAVTTIETQISTEAGLNTYAAIAVNASSFSGDVTATAICATGPGLVADARDVGSARRVRDAAAALRREHP